LKKFLLLLTLFVGLVFSLGCMGSLNALTGLDLELEFGENAVHPADFPASPIAQGERLMSMSMVAGPDSLNLPEGMDVELPEDQEYRMELVTYEVDASDLQGELAKARAQVEAAGFVLLSEGEENSGLQDIDSLSFTKDGVLFVLMGTEDVSSTGMTMLRLTPVEPTP